MPNVSKNTEIKMKKKKKSFILTLENKTASWSRWHMNQESRFESWSSAKREDSGEEVADGNFRLGKASTYTWDHKV